MATENPNHPQPDAIPDDERTGGEPNPSGKTGKPEKSPPAASPGGSAENGVR